MEKMTFQIEINASLAVVYDNMLGLTDVQSYKAWASVFNPTSFVEGSWDKGSKIYFAGIDENGKKGGMVSKITENIPNELVAILHYGFLDGDNEITTGEQVEKWAGGTEIYQYEENDGVTKVTVTMDVIEDYKDFFEKTYPMALEKLKTHIELD
jgi:hypothetical protein